MILFYCLVAGTSDFTLVPRNVAALVGDKVEFPCCYSTDSDDDYLRFDLIDQNFGWNLIYSEKKAVIVDTYYNYYSVVNNTANCFTLYLNTTSDYATRHSCHLYVTDRRSAVFVNLLGNFVFLINIIIHIDQLSYVQKI